MTSPDTPPRLPFPRHDRLDIAEQNRILAAERQISRVLTRAGDPAWLVTGYDAARQIFGEDRVGRSHPDPQNASRISNSVFFGGPLGDYSTEAETHRRMRRMLVPAFSARRVNRMRERIQSLADDLLEKVASQGPPIDFHEHVSMPLPIMVVCELLGVPYEDHRLLEEWEDDFTDLTDRDKAAAAHGKLTGYMLDFVKRRRREPGDDVISHMIAHEEESGFGDDVMAELAVAVLHGGHRNSVTRIDYGLLLFFLHPDQRELLRSDPSLVEGAVEEILRFAVPAEHSFLRYAHADLDVQGVRILRGDAILLSPEVANRDNDAFPDADRFDIRRKSDNAHLGFGHGAHYCLGAGLARAELQAFFGTVFRRFPALRLAVPRTELRYKIENQSGGLESLPVTW